MPKAKGMSGERWRELKSVGPRFRWARDVHGHELKRAPSARRASKESSSVRIGYSPRGRADRAMVRATAGHRTFRGVHSTWQQREPNSDPAIVHMTQSPPWARKRRNRRRTELAKASRRANR